MLGFRLRVAEKAIYARLTPSMAKLPLADAEQLLASDNVHENSRAYFSRTPAVGPEDPGLL